MSLKKTTLSISALLAMAATAQAAVPVTALDGAPGVQINRIDWTINDLVSTNSSSSNPGNTVKADLVAWGGQCDYFVSTGATQEMLQQLGCN